MRKVLKEALTGRQFKVCMFDIEFNNVRDAMDFAIGDLIEIFGQKFFEVTL